MMKRTLIGALAVALALIGTGCDSVTPSGDLDAPYVSTVPSTTLRSNAVESLLVLPLTALTLIATVGVETSKLVSVVV